MRFFSRKTILEVLAGICINLTSGWLGLLIVAPGFLRIHDFNQYVQSLTVNGAFAIVGLFFSLLFTELSKRYERT